MERDIRGINMDKVCRNCLYSWCDEDMSFCGYWAEHNIVNPDEETCEKFDITTPVTDEYFDSIEKEYNIK